jgi:hypothetical protein
VSTRVMGTYGYAAPEYVMTGEWTLIPFPLRVMYRCMDTFE